MSVLNYAVNSLAFTILSIASHRHCHLLLRFAQALPIGLFSHSQLLIAMIKSTKATGELNFLAFTWPMSRLRYSSRGIPALGIGVAPRRSHERRSNSDRSFVKLYDGLAPTLYGGWRRSASLSSVIDTLITCLDESKRGYF